MRAWGVREWNTEGVSIGTRRGLCRREKGLEALLAEEVDSGEDLLLLALPEPEDEQRLREAAGKRRSLYLYAAMSRLMARRLARS
jgi:hypothetical protein